MTFPFTDLSATKRRPAVVVWADPSGEDYVLAFISSRDISPARIDRERAKGTGWATKVFRPAA